MDYADIQKLQSVGKDAQAASAQYILRNDLEKVWEHVRGLKGDRVDVVLDNGELGFGFQRARRRLIGGIGGMGDL